jgi:hypothetical protein
VAKLVTTSIDMQASHMIDLRHMTAVLLEAESSLRHPSILLLPCQAPSMTRPALHCTKAPGN